MHKFKGSILAAAVLVGTLAGPGVQAQNAILNGSFETPAVSPGTPVSVTGGSGSFGPSAAQDWGIYHNTFGTTTTTLVSTGAFPGPEPFAGGGNYMMHVTAGWDNGLNGVASPPQSSLSAWMYVVSGSAQLMAFTNGGNTLVESVTDSTVGQWQFLSMTFGPATFNEPVIYGGPSGGDFYVDLVRAPANAPVPEASTLFGFGGMLATGGIALLRRRRALQ